MENADKYGQAALANACNTIAAAQSGSRNGTLNKESYGIGQLVAAGAIALSEARTALLSAALSNKIERHEAEETIASGLKAGMKSPRNLAENAAPAKVVWKEKRSTADYAKQLYADAVPHAGTLAERYLREHRQLSGVLPASFRFHPTVWHKGAGQTLPALVAPILRTDATGSRVAAVHVTFLDPASGAKTKADPAKKMFGTCKGGAIWLGDYATHMLCAEGIEKGLACQSAAEVPAAVGLSATLLPSIVWPRGTKRVTLCADPNGAGEAAIHKCAKALADDQVELLVCYPPHPGKDWDETPADEIRDAIQSAKPWSAPKQQAKQLPNAFQENDAFDTDEKGRPFKSEGNVLRALKWAAIEVSYDEFAQHYCVDGLPQYGPRLDDDALDELLLLIAREYYLKIAVQDFRRIVRAAARRNRFHPVRNYLAKLQWDGRERIDSWLIDYAGADDTPFIRAVGRIFLIAACRRVRQPGCKFDEMLVLESVEGRDKSTAFAVLAGNDWFTDEAPLTAAAREVIEQLRGHWIVECADLDGMRRAEVTTLKKFLSRRNDKATLKYKEETTHAPRQCVFAGTTNEENYLLSTTGNRRFWPVAIRQFDVEALKRDRDQLWAEAALCEDTDESIRLPRELWADAACEQQKRLAIDEWEDLVSGWLDREVGEYRLLESEHYRVTLADVARGALGISSEKLEQRVIERIAKCLRNAGWERSHKSHGRYFWQKL